MKLKTMAAIAAIAVGSCAFAHDLDTTVSNDYWCCWYHTNVVVSINSDIMAEPFSSVAYTERAGILERLITKIRGACLFFK